MVFEDYEVPVARSMLELAAHLSETQAHPLQTFTCYWAAFNNIYKTMADQHGGGVRLRRGQDGAIRTRQIGSVSVPLVDPGRERDQIDLAFDQFPEDLRKDLILHPSAEFFAYRTPRWRGQPIGADAHGQRVNGVLNVGYTVSAADPVWSPIDVAMFERYPERPHDGDLRDALAKQFLDVLYTVRNNTFHGGKSADDENDREVLEKALPLLVMIVHAFVRAQEAA